MERTFRAPWLCGVWSQRKKRKTGETRRTRGQQENQSYFRNMQNSENTQSIKDPCTTTNRYRAFPFHSSTGRRFFTASTLRVRDVHVVRACCGYHAFCCHVCKSPRLAIKKPTNSQIHVLGGNTYAGLKLLITQVFTSRLHFQRGFW